MAWRRDKARQLFSDGLQMALPEVPGGDVAFASAEVECAMHAASGGVNKDYRMKSRKLTFNIKDPRNPDLRRRVLAGDVTGAFFQSCPSRYASPMPNACCFLSESLLR